MTTPSQGNTHEDHSADARPAVNPYLALVVATVAVSFSAILIKLSHSPPLTIAAYRLSLTTLLLLPLLRGARLAQVLALRGRVLGLMVLSAVLLALHFALWTASLSYTSVASSVLFVTVHPALVAAVAWPLFGERLGRRGVLGIALTLVGSAVIAGGDLRLGGSALGGDALAFLGAVVFAGYLLLGREARRRLDAISYSVPVYGICALLLLGLTFPFRQSLLAVGPSDLLVFAGLVLIPTLGGHLVYNWTLRYVQTAVVSVSFLGEPVLSALLAWPILGQTPPVTTVAGGIVVLAGIWLTVKS